MVLEAQAVTHLRYFDKIDSCWSKYAREKKKITLFELISELEIILR